MRIHTLQGDIAEQKVDTLILNLLEGVTEPGGATGMVDRVLSGAIRDLIANGDFTGKANSLAVLYPRGMLPSQRIILVGLGPAEKLSLEVIRTASAFAVQKARGLGARRVATIAHGAGVGGLDAGRAAQAVVEGAILCSYEFQKKPATDQPAALETLTVVEFDADKYAAVEAGARAGAVVAEGVNVTRDLVNQPPNVCTPEYLASRAQQIAQDTGMGFAALGPNEMRDLGMGALLAVAQASALPPRLIILEHRPAGTENSAPIVLVGKGVTFDSGGLSIKTADSMPNMKGDMAGGAAVLGAMRAIGLLNVPLPVIGLVPAAENVIGSAGYRPADVIQASNGKTIEIISTDAEGRLLLADALVFAKRYTPAAVVDMATLTGACVIALGSGVAAGIFGTDQDLIERVLQAAAETGERAWPLPLYDDYRERINSDVADMKNSAGDRFSGVGVSAAFLKEFAEGYPWAHIDMAGMFLNEKGKAPWPRGASGYGVRLLVELARRWKV